MSYAVIATNKFKRNAEDFRRAHPELSERVTRILRDMAEDPHQPHLQLHPLRGPLAGQHAVRITQKYRITLTLQITEREIVLLDIGDHGRVYR